jgi:preprotein translocase subunit SecG
MDTVLLVIHMLLAVALIGVVMMQRTAQDGGGLMGGSSTMGGLFTARGSANLLTRTTSILATLFICTSLILGIMASHTHKARSLTEQIAPVAPASAPAEAPNPAQAPPAPTAPQVPVSK